MGAGPVASMWQRRLRASAETNAIIPLPLHSNYLKPIDCSFYFLGYFHWRNLFPFLVHHKGKTHDSLLRSNLKKRGKVRGCVLVHAAYWVPEWMNEFVMIKVRIIQLGPSENCDTVLTMHSTSKARTCRHLNWSSFLQTAVWGLTLDFVTWLGSG